MFTEHFIEVNKPVFNGQNARNSQDDYYISKTYYRI